MLDLKISGGEIVDGTGRARWRGDVGVKDGRIVAIGDLASEPAKEHHDATGRIVAPGFIDGHTHYDAQVFWDPTLSPSCYHGVTTVIGGFCGFSIAPMTPEAATYIKPMLARVEGMPLETLELASAWDWRSFGDYLSKIEGRLGLNAGFFAGHSAIRRIVMGARAVGEQATPEDLAEMQDLLDQSLTEGALGFSTTLSVTHNDADGNPVPSRWADRGEVLGLAGVVSRHEGTGLELLPNPTLSSEMREMLADISIAGQRPVNWNMILVTGQPEAEQLVARQLEASDYARARGGEVIALTLSCPTVVYMNLKSGQTFDAMPGLWREVFKWPVEQRLARFADPDVRRQLAADLASVSGGMEVISRIEAYTVVSTPSARNKSYEGRRIGAIAAEEGKAAIDVLLDIALADDLMTIFSPDIGGDSQAAYELRGKLWADDRVLIGASDAGAHLDTIDTFSCSTALLQKGVREHKVIGLEQAVHKITGRPATYFGLIDRGLIAEGYHADIVIFDEATVGRGATYYRYDLPGEGAFRLYADALGIDRVFVNGVQIVENGVHSGKLPGKVLRSGEDTRTVAMDALRHD